MAEQPSTLTRWSVRPQQDAAFVAAWQELAAMALALPAPPSWGALLRSIEDPRVFSGFGPYQNQSQKRPFLRRRTST